MKILYVITGLGMGGAEVVVCNLADKMHDLGHEVKIVLMTGKILNKPKNNIEIIHLDMNNIFDFSSSYLKMRNIIKLFNPDVIHSHMIHANIFSRLIRLTTFIPKLICTAHSSNEGGGGRMFAYRVTNFLSDYNTNVSKKAVDSLIAKGAFTKKNLQCIYNGIDIQKFRKKNIQNNQKEIYITTVGRFNEAKDYPNLINAISIINNKIPENIKFLFVGDGALREEMEKLCEFKKIKNRIIFMGIRNDIPDILSQSKFFILPSSYEGFGLVVAEAMACECFVIATDSGGVSEVMGGYGILVKPQDSELLADAILKAINITDNDIIENNLLAKKFIEENFSLESIVKKWLELYE